MIEDSERLQRFKRNIADLTVEAYTLAYQEDETLALRIVSLLGRADITNMNLIDAYYYDYCELPEKLGRNCLRDMYIIYGINDSGEIITKWVERGDLDGI